jgi:23S rRNA (pseudouridine1915-N3)-methyltransferase
VIERQTTRIDLAAVGTVAADVAPLVDDYERRIQRYVAFTSHVVKGEPLERGVKHVRSIEAKRLAEIIDRSALGNATHGVPPAHIVLFDLHGSTPTSEQFAEMIAEQRSLLFIIGGAAGVDHDVASRAHRTVSFGRMTMPHQLARVVATEQIYRAMKIMHGEPYHH